MYDAALAIALSGAKLELSIVDRAGKVANFFADSSDIVTAIQDAMLETALETQAIAFELCPVDTGFMRDHITVVTSPNNQVFEIGWQASDFFDAGLAFYPMFVVLGTRFMAARDPLTPAYAQTKPRYEQAVADAMRRAIERRAA